MINGGVIEGREISPDELFLVEIDGFEGETGRERPEKGAVRGESLLSPYWLRGPELTLPPDDEGFSRFSTPIGRADRCSGGVEDGGGVGRMATLGGSCAASRAAEVGSREDIGGKSSPL